jgi:hypothetical protein
MARADGHCETPRSISAKSKPSAGTREPAPPPLPSDPKVRAEILAGIERGLAEARAGVGVPWTVVKAELEAIIASKRK